MKNNKLLGKIKERFIEIWENLKEFVVKHKIFSGIVAFFLIIGIAGSFSEEETQSEEPKKYTETEEYKNKTQSEKEQEWADKKNKQLDKEIAEDKKEEEENGTKEEEPEPVVEEEPVEETTTDEDELKEALDEEVVASDVKGVEFGTGASDVTIELDGKSALSNKSTTRGFKIGTAEALLALKKSGIDVNSADIYVYSELTDGTGEKEQMVMSSRWDRATIDEMDEDALYTLPDHIETKAESSFMHPVTRD